MDFNATFIVSAISFIAFTIIMNAIFYKPLQKVVSERQKFIDDTLEEARSNNEKSQAILKDKDQQLDKTKHEAKKIILDKSEEVKQQKIDLTSQAHQKVSGEIETAKDGLKKSYDDAQNVLSKETKNLAETIAAKILGKE